MSNEKLQEILTQAVEQVKKRNGKIVLTEIAKLTPFHCEAVGKAEGQRFCSQAARQQRQTENGDEAFRLFGSALQPAPQRNHQFKCGS